ncbi:phage repressor protein CI [Hafnia alvei]|uniref:phage repressor protein CI n=1 Tax=Hafnia alvei TaxID=569 RepID=UPI00103E75CB|nr:phage repressor protein CI [Hafnia alvei]QBJ32303.1 Repressor protein CI [Hafnia alvei]
MNLETGARPAIERICEAYGFSSRLQLANHLGISNGSLGNRIIRDNFPADIVLRCALETGASIQWLSFGEGSPFNHAESDTIRIPAQNLDNGKLLKSSSIIFDKVMLPEHSGTLNVIRDGSVTYFVDLKDHELKDGKWLIEFTGNHSVKDLILLPGNKLRIDAGKYPIDSDINDVRIIGKIVATYLVNE